LLTSRKARAGKSGGLIGGSRIDEAGLKLFPLSAWLRNSRSKGREASAVCKNVEGRRDAKMEELIKVAEKRGYVTVDELNQALPTEQTSPGEIEDILAMLKGRGIDVVEASEVPERSGRSDWHKSSR
jgi:hypothetical protein